MDVDVGFVGSHKRFIYKKCENCGGLGGWMSEERSDYSSAGAFSQRIACSECNGSGEVLTDQYIYI